MAIEKFQPGYTFSEERVEELKKVMPEAFADGKIDWESLQEALGNFLEDQKDEHFGLSWPEKSKAKAFAFLPPEGTLIPAPGEGVNEDATENIFIEGENAEVLKLLQKSYKGQIKMIYIDPPYNTGHDFVYKDNFSEPLEDYLKKTGQIDDEGQRVSTNNESSGRFHSNWLSMMYPRLRLAKELLTDDGVIFVSIDDNEVHHLRLMLDEIIGENNFIGMFSVEINPKGRKNGRFISVTNEYCLIYAKEIESAIFKKIIPKHANDMIEDENGDFIRKSGKRVLMGENTLNRLVTNFQSLKHYSAYIKDSDLILKQEQTISDIDEELLKNGYKRYVTFREGLFVENTYTKEKFKELFESKSLDIREDKIYEKHFSDMMQIKSVLTNDEYEAVVDNKKIYYKIDLKTTSAKQHLIEMLGGEYFSFPKNVSFMEHLISLHSNSSAIIVDFFAGSGTTAHAVMQLNAADGGNRKFILVQMPEATKEDSEAFKAGYKNIAEIAKERIRRVINGYGDDPKPIEGGGFQVYKLAKSSFKKDEKYVGDDLSELFAYLKKSESKLVEDWMPENLMVEIILQEGFPLDAKSVRDDNFTKNEVFIVSSPQCEHMLTITFDEKIDSETVQRLDLSGSKNIFFCLDRALSDEQKIVLADKGLIKTI